MKEAVLITGSAIRLGRAIALDFAKKGYDIALHYNSSEEQAKNTVEEIEKLGVSCKAFKFDLSKTIELEENINKVFDYYPNLNVLVNSASAYTHGEIKETKIEDYEALFDINLKAPFFLTKFFAKNCNKGNIINIIDNKISYNQNAYSAYILTKKSLYELTKLSALEFAPNIRVNAVSPGVILPASVRTEEYINYRINGIPLKMKGNEKNISDAIFSLIDNDFITGQIITVDGGECLMNTGLNAVSYESKK
ncbi:MAG: SDR family oxidoreductase [Candidatus Sericytochromatia bacterium]